MYQNSSISALARFFLGLTSSSCVEPEGSKIEEMLDLITKYGEEFVQHEGHIMPPEGHVVLLTGSTGAIGSNVLAELIQCTQVTKIFALNRSGTTALEDRQKEALTSRGFSDETSKSTKIVLIEADLAQPSFGLTETLIKEVRIPSPTPCTLTDPYSTQIRDSITHIIHIGMVLRHYLPPSNLTPGSTRLAC